MPINWERVKAICFDVDGTLSDTDNHMVASLTRSLQVFRWLIPESGRKQLARGVVMMIESPGNLLYGVADRLGIDSTLISVSNWLNRHAVGRKPAHFWMIPGVKKMLAALSQRFPLAIVSARNPAGVEKFLTQFNLSGFFQAVASSQTCRHTKPYPDPVIWAAQQLGVSPQDCLMVGDTVVDIQAGRAAGAQTVGVLCGFGTRRELERAGAGLILKSTPGLIHAVGAGSDGKKGFQS
jgi:phosphoglycolate phosphatase-like HAD superfamily hydrolase